MPESRKCIFGCAVLPPDHWLPVTVAVAMLLLDYTYTSFIVTYFSTLHLFAALVSAHSNALKRGFSTLHLFAALFLPIKMR